MSIISNPPSKPYPHDLCAHNTAQQPAKSFPFTLTIPPRTDLWRKPPSTFSATQPTFYTPLPLSALASATVKIALTPELLYDQAGIVLLWPQRPERWIKAGVEFVGGALKKSVVATGVGGWSDWSVAGSAESGKPVAVSMEREPELGSALVVRCQGEVLRECQWVFEEASEEEVWVGFYGARPADVEESLQVSVVGWEVVVWCGGCKVA
jgi:regulation of enolase protein 1 (concanavalin A-like superfamily)